MFASSAYIYTRCHVYRTQYSLWISKPKREQTEAVQFQIIVIESENGLLQTAFNGWIYWLSEDRSTFLLELKINIL